MDGYDIGDKNRVISIAIACFLYIWPLRPFSPSRQLGHLGCCPFQVEHFDRGLLKVALGMLWDSICSTCQKALEAGDMWYIIFGEYAAGPPFVFYFCLLLPIENRNTRCLNATAATGLVPISSRRTPSIKWALRKTSWWTVHGHPWTVFREKLEDVFWFSLDVCQGAEYRTLADVERI